MFENLELGEIAVFNNFRVHEVGAGRHLKGGEVIVLVNCLTNSTTTASECLCDVLSQFIS